MTADTQNTHSKNSSTELSLEQIAYSVRVTREALDQGADDLPYEISERLRAIRVRALAQAKQSTTVQEPTPTTHRSDVFNWRHQLAGWFKGGVAVSAFALALMISVVSIRSELTTDVAVSDRAMSMSAHSTEANQAASNESSIPSGAQTANPVNTSKITPNSLLSMGHANNNVHTAPSHNRERNASAQNNSYAGGSTLAVNNAPVSTLARAELANPAPTATSVNHNTASVDDEISMVLHEQIPLQAYLNDDFARFANHQGISSIEKLSNTTGNSSPEE